jgi:hypothetical protein
MAKSFPELMASARQMLVGLEANTAEVAKRGATSEFIKSGKSLLASVEAMGAERDEMKAALKIKTASYDVARAQLKTWNSEATSAVKQAFRDQKEKWADFGIKIKVKAKNNKNKK